MIGRSKNGTENYPRECFWTQEKETWVKFNPGLSANRPSNNWAQGFNSLLAGDPLRRKVRAGLEGFRLRESWLLKKWWSTMPPSQRLSFFALWSHRGRDWLVMKRAGSWGGERRQAKRHLARFLLPTVLYAQKGLSVKGADERIWGLQSSVRRPYITHLPVRCSVLSVLGRSLLLVSKSLLEWQRGLKYNTFWKERYIFNGNMRSLSLRVSWERSFDFRDWTSLDFSVAVNTLIAVKTANGKIYTKQLSVRKLKLYKFLSDIEKMAGRNRMKVMMKILRLSPRWVLDLVRTNPARLIELIRKKRRTRNSSDRPSTTGLVLLSHYPALCAVSIH